MLSTIRVYLNTGISNKITSYKNDISKFWSLVSFKSIFYTAKM